MFRFPWGDMHSLNLGWFLQKFNELREDWATAEAGIDGALDAEIEKAEDALSEVFDARDAAAASATAAAGSASAAGTSATAAQNSATGAASSATLANQKATAAGLSEAAAAQSATQAGNSAAAAAGSATAAGQSATNAAGSATAAGNSATAAAGSATAASNSATAAAGSAAAAQAVEESIPEDYSSLSAQVIENTAVIDELSTTIEDVLEKTRNINISPIGRYRAIAPDYQPDIVTINDNYLGLAELVPCDAETTYTVSFFIESLIGTKYVNYYDENKTRISGENVAGGSKTATFTTPENCRYIHIYSYRADGITITPDSHIQIEEGTTATEYIPPFVAVTAPIIAKELQEPIADTALVINDFRIVKNVLYRITAPIAAGGTLTPNTNCVATTVADILKLLLS